MDNAIVTNSTIFFFGVAVGSFLNVVIYRYGSGIRMHGRSKCLSCGKTLSPFMLVPLFSFLFSRGRCRYCKSKLSLQYPLVEFFSGALFVTAVMIHDVDLLSFDFRTWSLAGLDALTWSILLVITVYDLRHKIIPDIFSLLFALCAGLILFLKWQWGLIPQHYIPLFESVPRWIDIAAAPILALPFFLLWYFSGGRAMGLGDAKLSWGIGWFLGFSKGLTAVIFGFWIAFFPSLFLLFLPKKHFTMKSEIPFAPFLILGTLSVYISGFDLFSWTL